MSISSQWLVRGTSIVAHLPQFLFTKATHAILFLKGSSLKKKKTNQRCLKILVGAAVSLWKRTQESSLTWLLSLWGLLSFSSGKRIFGRCYLGKAIPSITSISGSPLPWLPSCVCFSLAPRNTNPVASHAYLHIKTEAILAWSCDWPYTSSETMMWRRSKHWRKNSLERVTAYTAFPVGSTAAGRAISCEEEV